MKRITILVLLIGLITHVAYSQVNGKKGSPEKPNILFILVDDLGWADIGAFGSDFYETPNIDKLTADGMMFKDAYAASPVCSPTRASIMTGKNPARTNTTDWFGAPQPSNNFAFPGWMQSRIGNTPTPLMPAPYQEHMSLDEVTIAEALKEGGYTTFFAGKWHLGYQEKYWPEHQGFDINKGGYFKGAPNTNGSAEGYFSPYGNPRLEDGPAGEYLPNRLAEETIGFMKEHKEDPFLAYLSFYSVHTPLMTTDQLQQKYQEKKKDKGVDANFGTIDQNIPVRLNQTNPVFAGMVEAMDRAVGRVLHSLEQQELSSNTVVIFMSDNGGLSTIAQAPTSNKPLKAGKGWLYEGGIREPMIIKWPGVTQPGSTSETPVTSSDFYPTMLEMAGLPLRPDQHKDGKSLAPILKGKELQERDIFWHYPHYAPQGGFPGSVIRSGEWKLIHNYQDNTMELYNMENDISEEHNLVQKYPERAIELYQKLAKWRNEVDASSPVPNPEYKK